jgi:5'-nucleotidase
VALEGTLFGVSSFAISLETGPNDGFGPAGVVARKLAETVVGQGLPAGVALNVNVPNVQGFEQVRGVRMTHVGRRVFGSGIEEKVDPRGRTYYWIGGRERGHVEAEAGTDVDALAGRCVSVTPIRTDLTDYLFLEELRRWRL